MTTDITRGSVPIILPSPASPLMLAVTRATRFVQVALQVARERRQLARLDERMLGDIGLSRSMADREASRDFFDVPEHRLYRR